ncbi:MAG: GTP 3',8-cyclase MoaA [Microthrixaceae bacterium]
MKQLVDTYGRVHRDLRISVTDRCNFRCTYCMPAEGMEWLPREDVLTFEEIERVSALLVDRYGFTSIRLTGGEPTVRAHLPRLVGKLAKLDADLALTTNGSTLALAAPGLAEAGLRRINVSLDTLKADRFVEMTRRDSLSAVLDGIRAAKAAGLAPVKINVVAMAGVNDDELVDFARFGRTEGVEVRFIEFMPLDADGEWRRESVLSQAQIVERIDAAFPLVAEPRGSAPADRFAFVDGGGALGGTHIGVIPSVTQPFCGNCDRVRLTADGKLRNCLFAVTEVDLRALIRAGADDDELAAAIETCVQSKWAGHAIGKVHFIRPSRSMSQIGG